MRFILLLLMIITSPAISQSISTINVGNPDDDILVDQEGNLYISQFSSGNILKYTPDGQASLFKSGFETSNGLALDASNNLYVCDFTAQKIHVLDAEAEIISTFSINGNPSGILKDRFSDEMIFTNFSNNTIHRLSSNGIITTINSNDLLNGPVGLAQTEDGRLFVSNFNNATVFEVLPDNNLRYIAKLPSEGEFPFLGFITYGKGKIWATMIETHKIYSIHPNDEDNFTVFAGSVEGSKDGDISEATFSGPNGIAFSNDLQSLYISDLGSSNLRIISDLALSNTNAIVHHSSLEVFPSPVKETLNLQYPNDLNGQFTITIFNSMGKTIKSIGLNHKRTDGINKIDITDLSSGLYRISINSKKHIYSTSFTKM